MRRSQLLLRLGLAFLGLQVLLFAVGRAWPPLARWSLWVIPVGDGHAVIPIFFIAAFSLLWTGAVLGAAERREQDQDR